MTSLGTCRFRRDAGTNLRAPPTRVIARRPKADAAISSRHLRLRRGFPVLRPVLRDCRALLRKARNDKLGGLSHSEGRSAELASAALPCHSEERSDVGISCRHLRFRRGFPVFRPVLRDCRALLRKARNDKSRAFTVLTIGCQFRRYSAGSGVPLPYNITSHCKRAGRAVRPFSILLFHFHSAEDIDGAHAHAEVPALGIGVKIQVDLIALDAAADVLGHAVAIDILAVV